MIPPCPAAACHDPGERYRQTLQDPGFAPASKPQIDRVPTTAFLDGTPRHGAPRRSRQHMPLMIERFCSGRLPCPRYSGSIGIIHFRMRHFASLRSPLVEPASKKQS
jgi:hypothetical protein